MINSMDFIKAVTDTVNKDINEYLELCRMILDLSYEHDTKNTILNLLRRKKNLENKYGLVDHSTSVANEYRNAHSKHRK